MERRDPLGGIRQTHYDLDGGVLAHTGSGADGMSVVKREGNRTEITHANGSSTTVVSSSAGVPLAMTDACGGQWTWQYDAHGEVSQKIAPSGTITSYDHDRGFLDSIEFANGAVFRQSLNRRDGAIKMWDSEGMIAEMEFDLRGQLRRITGWCAAPGYAAPRRRWPGQSSYRRRGLGYRFSHDPLGNVTSIERSDGSRELYDYDEFGRLVRHTDPIGSEVWLTQGPEDGLLNLRLPCGRLHEFQYDPLDRVMGQTFTDGRQEHYSYDEHGELAMISVGPSVMTRLVYDPVGLISEKGYWWTTRRYSRMILCAG